MFVVCESHGDRRISAVGDRDCSPLSPYQTAIKQKVTWHFAYNIAEGFWHFLYF